MGEVVFIGWFPSRFRLKNWAFSSNMQDKLSKKLFPPALARVLEVEWHLGACERNFSHPGACSTHLGVPTLLGRTFSPFSSSFWVFSFIKLVLGLRIEFFSLCSVFRGLLILHSRFSKILLRCFALPICMILQWITSKTPKNYFVSGKLELRDSKWRKVTCHHNPKLKLLFVLK